MEAERGGSRGRRWPVRRSEQPGGAGTWAGDSREQRTAGRARCRRAVDSAGCGSAQWRAPRALERARSLLCRGLGAAGSHISRPVPPSDVTHSATMAQWPRTRHLTGPRECTPPHEAGEEADMDAGRCRPKPPFALYAGKATPDDGPGWYQSHCHARARSCVACGSLCTASGRSLTSIPARRSKFARCTAPTPVERTVGLRECTADADRYPRFVSARGGACAEADDGRSRTACASGSHEKVGRPPGRQTRQTSGQGASSADRRRWRRHTRRLGRLALIRDGAGA